MFWGLIMEPNKRYTQVVEKPFHISQAAMDISTGNTDASQVMITVDGKNFLICTLQKKNTTQVPLDLYFKAGESISFLSNGGSNIHLTGYLDPEFEDEEDDEDDDEDEDEVEVPALTAIGKNKRKVENNVDNGSTKKAKLTKKAEKEEAEDSSDDSDDDNHLQKLLDGDLDSEENDDSFQIDSAIDNSDEDDDEDAEDEAEGEEADSDEDEEETTAIIKTKKEEPELDTSKLTKSQKKRLQKKKKLEKQKALVEETPKSLVNGVTKKQDKKEKKKEVKNEEASAVKKEKKVLAKGVEIEDIKVGNGPAAKPGKTVMVYYEGRLKQNNKKFDDCQKGPGFKFRLGAKEVISGWDVGVVGMKAGGKRRIVCPPPMAYGTKGSPPVIPPNSTLVFEVELKEVK